MADATFDGVTKKITLVGAVHDVQRDLYSAWKRWVTSGDGHRYAPAFRTFGGDPTSPGQKAPAYFFLTEGWRVLINGQTVDISTNLYTDEGDSPVEFINGGVATIKNSDSPTVDTGGTFTATDSTRLEELHRFRGLDASNPWTITPSQESAGGDTLTLTGDGVTSTTVTRNP